MFAQHGLRLLSLCALVVLASLGTVRADEKPCTAHANGNYYDLSRLSSNKDYEFTSPAGQEYVLNVCKPVAQEAWAPKVDKPEDVAGFTRHPRGDFSLGDVNTTVLVREGNPLITMTDGTRCIDGGERTGSTVIRFICDSYAGTGQPKLIATLPPDEDRACSFFVEWRTEIACPTSEGGAFGRIVSVLAIVAAVVFALYMIGGILYNRYVLELQGLEQVPRFSFFSFSDTLEFFRDCVGRVREQSSDAWHSRSWGSSPGGSWGSSGRHGYRGAVGTADEAQTMLIGGPPGFLDEQDDEDEEAATPRAEAGGRLPGNMDANGHQQQPIHDDQSQNFVPSQYMYPSSEDEQGYLVYPPPIPGYQGVIQQQHPAHPPRQMSDSDLQQAMQYQRSIHMLPGQHFAPPAPSPNMYDPLSPPISGSDTSGDGIYHSRNSSATGSPSSSRANSLVHRHPLRYNPTPSPTSSSAGRRSRGHSLSDDDDQMGVNMAESLANTRKEATRRQRIEAEQRRRDELRDGYARLKDVLPVSNQKSSKVSLLERATNHITHLEKTTRQLQQRLAALDAEVTRLRSLNEKISLGTSNSPSPGANMDTRPLSPPPEGSPQQSGQNQPSQDTPAAESSPSASESGY
ncbi:hypothetical protein C2E23DRAFT_718615 [Lenzites betulinus]|nr:hypothetical protein C2E23DRAFT_718615 [Lenzites betulinus]